MEVVGFTIEVAGKLLVAYMALSVHHRFRKEHKVDEKVFRVMSREGKLGILGMTLILLGFLLQLPSKL